MNPPSVDIKEILAAESSLALTYATDLFVSEMPDSPGACVAVYDTGGENPESNYIYQRPTVQVRVRGDRGGYVAAHTLAQDIRDTLHDSTGYEASGSRYVGIWCQGDVLFIGYDDKHRPLFSVNFRMHRTVTS